MISIHITFDHPDSIKQNKTKAIKNLYSSQNYSTSLVFSLNRTANPFRSFEVLKEDHGYTSYIYGLPLGIMLFFWMYLAHYRIRRTILQNDLQPKLIHAHKLTFEGIIAFFLSRSLKIPYILTIRGNTDMKVLQKKLLYRFLYRKIVMRAEKVIFLAPWPIKQIKKILGDKAFAGNYHIIPNIVAIDNAIKIDSERNNKFVTAFHLNNLKGKNIKRVIKAFDRVIDKYPDFGLDIVGGGSGENHIRKYISKCNNPTNFSLLGNIRHQDLLKLYAAYRGFVLPSYPETFGIVFIEALVAGTPIIYSKNSGIDGYFDQLDVGIRVKHTSILEIASAIERIIVDHEFYSNNIKEAINIDFFDKFSQQKVSEIYSKVITEAMT